MRPCSTARRPSCMRGSRFAPIRESGGRSSPGIEDTPRKFGSPSFPACGYEVKLLDEATGKEVGVDQKGVLAIVPPLPPGCMSTVWGDDERFVKTYFETVPGRMVYSTFDWA